MPYPQDFTEQDIMEYEYEYNRFVDLQDPKSLLLANAECQIVALEQRQAALEEYVKRPYA